MKKKRNGKRFFGLVQCNRGAVFVLMEGELSGCKLLEMDIVLIFFGFQLWDNFVVLCCVKPVKPVKPVKAYFKTHWR